MWSFCNIDLKEKKFNQEFFFADLTFVYSMLFPSGILVTAEKEEHNSSTDIKLSI
jgi:hypothetical protein